MQLLYYQLQGGRSPLAPQRDQIQPLLSPAVFDAEGEDGSYVAVPEPDRSA